jgi:hypothetical protein
VNDHDDDMEFKRMCKSKDMAFFLHELFYNTRKGLIYDLENKELDNEEIIEFVFIKLNEIREKYHIEIDDLIC